MAIYESYVGAIAINHFHKPTYVNGYWKICGCHSHKPSTLNVTHFWWHSGWFYDWVHPIMWLIYSLYIGYSHYIPKNDIPLWVCEESKMLLRKSSISIHLSTHFLVFYMNIFQCLAVLCWSSGFFATYMRVKSTNMGIFADLLHHLCHLCLWEMINPTTDLPSGNLT